MTVSRREPTLVADLLPAVIDDVLATEPLCVTCRASFRVCGLTQCASCYFGDELDADDQFGRPRQPPREDSAA